jgi:hypothetical protein
MKRPTAQDDITGRWVSQPDANLAESAPVQWIEKLSKAQRVVLVVAIGVALLAVGDFLLSLGQHGFAFGWTGYASLTALAASGAGPSAWVRLVVWLALTCLWAVVSIRLLRPSRNDDSD